MRLTERIQSRKFLLALSACIYFAVAGGIDGFPSITQVVVAYLAVQAAQDALSDWQDNRTTAQAPTPVSPASDGDDEEVSGWTGSVI